MYFVISLIFQKLTAWPGVKDDQPCCLHCCSTCCVAVVPPSPDKPSSPHAPCQKPPQLLGRWIWVFLLLQRDSYQEIKANTAVFWRLVALGKHLLCLLWPQVGVRRASGSVRFDSDGSGRPVTWDSFGIWDNRFEEPVLLPSSIRYGKPIPQVTGWMDESVNESVDTNGLKGE